MSIENQGFLSKPAEKKSSSKLKKTVAILGSTAAVLMATNAFGGGKAVENKGVPNEKEKTRIGMTDARIERPKNFGSAPERTANDLNQDNVPVKERIFTDNEKMAEAYLQKDKEPKDRIYKNQEEMDKANEAERMKKSGIR